MLWRPEGWKNPYEPEKQEIQLGLGYYLKRIEALESLNISIKDCPQCGHPVLAQFVQEWIKNMGTNDLVNGTGLQGVRAHYRCLACGSKFTCEDKCVCKLMEE